MKDFKNKVVVITGAGSGMGREYALLFAKLGAKLALCDIELEGVKLTQQMIIDKYASGTFIEIVDVGDRNAVFTFADKVKENLGLVDVLINNAGIEGCVNSSWQMLEEEIDTTMRVNFYGVINGTQAFLAHMFEQNSGVIVNVSSIFGFIGTPLNADYCASKFAVRGYTEALMAKLADSPIQIHLLHPGGIKTNITKNPHSQVFSNVMLTTAPDIVAQHVVNCIVKNKARIVIGNQSHKVYWAAKLLSLNWLSRLIWKESKSYISIKERTLFFSRIIKRRN